MGILAIFSGVLVALVGAWIVTRLVGMMSGERPDSLLSTWWEIFSKMGRSPASYAEPLPEALTRRKFSVGDSVRVLLLPLDAERSMPDERRELYRRCAGKIFRVEGIDQFGSLELHVLDDGSQSPDRYHHILFLDQQYAERAIASDWTDGQKTPTS
ncbi:MAG TPA: hypothetical protein VGI88_02305 [Verrucomicrobiae bacterium]|jgi:hypothetical protein